MSVRLAALVTLAAGGLVASTRQAGAQSAVKGNPLAEIGVKYQGERAKTYADIEVERQRIGAEINRLEKVMTDAENGVGTGKKGRGPDWRAASADRQRAVAAIDALDARRTERLNDIGRREAAELALLHGKQQQEDEAARRSFINTYAVPGASVAASALAMLAGVKFGKSLGKTAISAAGKAVAGVSDLGKQSASLAKAGGILTNTPRGDRLTGLVHAAPDAIAKAGRTPTALTVGNVINGTSVAVGAGSIVASFVVNDPQIANALRIEGATSLGLGIGGAKALAAARAALPRVSAASLAQIASGSTRLAREAAGKTKAQIAAIAKAGDARANGRAVTAVAQMTAKRAKASAAAAHGRGDVAVATARASGRARVATETANRAAFRARVQTKQTRLKASATPAALPAPKPVVIATPRIVAPSPARVARQRAPYKDTWTDKLGRTYTRKDHTIRKH